MSKIPIYEVGKDAEGYPIYKAQPSVDAMIKELKKSGGGTGVLSMETLKASFLAIPPEDFLDTHDCTNGQDSGCPCTALRYAYNNSDKIMEAELDEMPDSPVEERMARENDAYLDNKMK